MTFAPAVERPWRDAWPLPAQTDDANPWATEAGWLYCRREGVRVPWVGSVKCDHRQTEKRDSKTYCQTCKRQLYL